MSKANVLTKSVEYVQRMHSRRESVDAEIASLQAQVQQLNDSIMWVTIDHVMLIMWSQCSQLQEQLPASGAASGVSGKVRLQDDVIMLLMNITYSNTRRINRDLHNMSVKDQPRIIDFGLYPCLVMHR